ncbi:hypothetical protein TSUD_46300 [Trifolium subterraneum]|uniref:Uncharacterized protein n=1 Tax=Trifolium subterraneum TaxID=3900 RepID=A0A2Z6PLK5_TRISU|nr:hypothetical protein TSUD_46300 [Trifolium subterraneum]
MVWWHGSRAKFRQILIGEDILFKGAIELQIYTVHLSRSPTIKSILGLKGGRAWHKIKDKIIVSCLVEYLEVVQP